MTPNTFKGPLHEFVANAHGNLDRVRELLEAHPELLEARFADWDETAMEAAAHTGGRDIARLLMARGARPTHAALAMLGRADDLRARLTADPQLAQTPGAHGISLLYHAALSGDPAILGLVWAAGARTGLDQAVHGAVAARSLPALRWLLDHGAGVQASNVEGKTPAQAAEARGWAEGQATLAGGGGGPPFSAP